MKIPASGLGVLKSTNKSLLEVLETNSQLLESINIRFWSMVRGQRENGRRLGVSCFCEELPLLVVGQIVSKESATLEGYTSVSVHANYSDMVKFRTENDNGFKQLVGDPMRWKSEGLTEKTTIDAIRHIEKTFPHCDWAGREKWREYVPHGLQVLNRSSWCRIAERYDLFMTVGLCLYRDRRFKEAIRCFEAASEWMKENFTEDNDSRLSLEHALAGAYLNDRRIKEAIEIFEHVVAVEKMTLADEDHSRLTLEHTLASAYVDGEMLDEAIQLLEHVVAVEKCCNM
jgi:tetratricopeptide (TPR) repeat protein